MVVPNVETFLPHCTASLCSESSVLRQHRCNDLKFLLMYVRMYISICCVENINISKPKTYFIYRQFRHSEILRSAHTVYLYVLCGSENKQRLFPYTTLTDWFV